MVVFDMYVFKMVTIYTWLGGTKAMLNEFGVRYSSALVNYPTDPLKHIKSSPPGQNGCHIADDPF